MKRNYSLFIKDILEAIEKIEEFVNSMDYEDFINDDKTASAVVRKLEIIGEASKNVPNSIRQKYETLPWKDMARMRDKISHAYFGVDYEIVWEVIKEKLPELKSIFHQILDDIKNRKREKKEKKEMNRKIISIIILCLMLLSTLPLSFNSL